MNLLAMFFMILFLSTVAGTYAVAKMYVLEKQKLVKYVEENKELTRKVLFYEDRYDFGTEYEDYLNSKKEGEVTEVSKTEIVDKGEKE